ncbi:MAG TPA: CsbD family protein [Kofleriaceae bacterium]
MDKLKGKGKQIEGKLTGDKVRVAEGTAQKAKGDVEGAVSRVVRKVKARVQRAKKAVASAVRTSRR